ncbi:MAG: DUF3098 domain-containing protein [Alistipes sp.]|nr:DUF3098 domain-containing protein [Alistipes sp.]
MENKDNKIDEGRMPFTMKNYVMMLIGVLVIILGFVLMSGGGEHTVTEFDESIFSFRRITLAPIVVIAGFVVVGVAIMKRFDISDKE